MPATVATTASGRYGPAAASVLDAPVDARRDQDAVVDHRRRRAPSPVPRPADLGAGSTVGCQRHSAAPVPRRCGPGAARSARRQRAQQPVEDAAEQIRARAAPTAGARAPRPDRRGQAAGVLVGLDGRPCRRGSRPPRRQPAAPSSTSSDIATSARPSTSTSGPLTRSTRPGPSRRLAAAHSCSSVEPERRRPVDQRADRGVDAAPVGSTISHRRRLGGSRTVAPVAQPVRAARSAARAAGAARVGTQLGDRRACVRAQLVVGRALGAQHDRRAVALACGRSPRSRRPRRPRPRPGLRPRRPRPRPTAVARPRRLRSAAAARSRRRQPAAPSQQRAPQRLQRALRTSASGHRGTTVSVSRAAVRSAPPALPLRPR